MLAILAALALAAPAPSSCAYDAPAMVALSFDAFDQGKEGWRKVAAAPGCHAAAAELIVAYREAHRASLDDQQLDGLASHEGQMWAAANDYPRAIQAFQRKLQDPQIADRIYGEATVAFLRRDRASLLAARERLAAVPPPADFAEAAARFRATYGRSLTWPTNLDVVDGLIACFEKPYSEAYKLACRPKP